MNPKIHEIGKEFYLVRSDEADFHRNIYIKIFKGERKNINMVMDPGSKTDIELLSKVLKELIGGIEKIDLIFLSHQDPDVSSSTPFLVSAAPRSIILLSKDTMRLIKMYGIPESRMKAVEDFKTETVLIKDTGHRIRFIPAYYCHFRGAMMLQDLESNVLFTGDFMAGLDTIDGNPIYATEIAWDGILLFHTIYMPSNTALRETIDRIGLLNPLPDVIAPQHGYVVKSDLIFEFMNRLLELNVGIDLLTSKEPAKEQFLFAINEFKDKLKTEYPLVYQQLLERFSIPSSFTSPFIIKGDDLIDVKIPPSDALKFILYVLESEVDEKNIASIKTLLLMSLEKFDISHLVPTLHTESSKYERIDINTLLTE